LLEVDADDALSRHEDDAGLDTAGFINDIGNLIRGVVDSGRRVRVFGELVAVLWQRGDVAGAIELEQAWNELGRGVAFSLLCAYPQSVAADGHEGEFCQVCDTHAAIVGDDDVVSRAGDIVVARAEDARTFPCELQSPGVARHFVARTLRAWGRGDLVDDASIVIAELATNAVLHARSEFLAAVSSDGAAVRVSVRDASPTVPAIRDPGTKSISGRGLMLVATVAERWGTELLSDGKVVWADLR
jgi:anti-sigma regulatory factor (Ser/Thr protein kinase)